MIVQEIGQTSERRPHLIAIVTSPENHRNLAKYQGISKCLALADVDDAAVAGAFGVIAAPGSAQR